MANEAELKKLLKIADGEISVLRRKVDEGTKALDEVIASHGRQGKEMANLQTRVQELEGLLHVSDETLSEAMIVMGGMKDAVSRMKKESETTVEMVKESKAQIELTETIEKIAEKAGLTEQVEVLDEYTRQIAKLRQKTKPGMS